MESAVESAPALHSQREQSSELRSSASLPQRRAVVEAPKVSAAATASAPALAMAVTVLVSVAPVAERGALAEVAGLELL
jgi:hypothetical protein